LDIHHAIVQLLEDALWNTTSTTSSNDKNDGDDDNKDDGPNDGDDGCFFIGNVLYNTKGKVDYAALIVKWIDGSGPPNPAWRGYLGLSMKEIVTKRHEGCSNP
jgi:hypothetical protein